MANPVDQLRADMQGTVAQLRADFLAELTQIRDELGNTQTGVTNTLKGWIKEFVDSKIKDLEGTRIAPMETEVLKMKNNNVNLRGDDSIIDKTSLGRPPIFKDDQSQNFVDWSHKVRVYLFGSNPNANKLLQWCAKQKTAISLDGIPKEHSTDAAKISQNLYVLCTGHTEGEAQGIVRSNVDFNGLEVWRLLHHRFSPRTAGRSFLTLRKLITPKQCVNVANVREAITAWEEEAKRYEDSSGTTPIR